MFPEDRIFRPVIHPKVCPAGVLDEDAYFQFRKIDNETYRISVGSRFLARNIDGAHSFGLTVADAQDSSARRNKGLQGRVCYYIGFYDATWGEIRQAETDTYYLELKWSPENGLDAHFNLSLCQKSTEKTKAQRKNDRLAIQSKISSFLNGIYSFDYGAAYGAGAPQNIAMPNKGRICE